MLEKAYRCAKQENADVVVYGASNFLSDFNDEYYVNVWLDERQIPDGNNFNRDTNPEFLFNFSGTVAWNKLFRREFVKKERLLFLDTKRGEDTYFVIMALAVAERISVVRENLMGYRIGSDNSLSKTRDETIMDSLYVMNKIYKDLLSRVSDDKLWNSFKKICCTLIVDDLANCKSWMAFEKLYVTFKEEYLKKFHMMNMGEKDFFDLNDNLPDIDVVIVSVIGRYHEIYPMLKKKTIKKIISLETILHDMEQEGIGKRKKLEAEYRGG